VGFLGPNGAGKTTTMRVLATFLSATEGTATIDGLDVFRDSMEVRRRVGYLPETVPLYTDMRVQEYLRYRGRLRGLKGKALAGRLAEVVELCGLGEVRRRIVGQLSKGYVQRVGLADSLLHDPDVLILDEPTIGLDPNQIRHIRHLIKSLGQRHTVLLSSHILSEVQMICERVLILNRGRIVASDRTENLLRLAQGGPQVLVEVLAPPAAVAPALQAAAGVLRVTVAPAGEWTQAVCDCEPGTDTRPAIFRTVVAQGWVLREMRVARRNLEDVFVEITAEQPAPGGTERNGNGR